jgi:diaminopimelate epimerase
MNESKSIPFWKMSGAGNDFIILDNRERQLRSVRRDFIKRICCRKLSVGADGVGIISESNKADFKARFYNSDGSLSRFCGNGNRCVSRYAYLNGIAGIEMSFEADDGIHAAKINRESVSISVPDVKEYDSGFEIRKGRRVYRGSLINVGVPHFVTETPDLEKIDIAQEGSFLRFHRVFSAEGANVDFIQCESHHSIKIRTYERGVERETLACGSGCVAAALYASRQKDRTSPLFLLTRPSLLLKVSFQVAGPGWKDIFLEGDARVIFKGMLDEEAMRGFNPQFL